MPHAPPHSELGQALQAFGVEVLRDTLTLVYRVAASLAVGVAEPLSLARLSVPPQLPALTDISGELWSFAAGSGWEEEPSSAAKHATMR